MWRKPPRQIREAPPRPGRNMPARTASRRVHRMELARRKRTSSPIIAIWWRFSAISWPTMASARWRPASGGSETRPYKTIARFVGEGALRDCGGRAQGRRQDGGLPDGRQALDKPRTSEKRGGPHRAGLRPAPTRLVRRHSQSGGSETRPYKAGAQALARALRERAGRAQRRRQDGGLPDGRQALHKPRTTKQRVGRY